MGDRIAYYIRDRGRNLRWVERARVDQRIHEDLFEIELIRLQIRDIRKKIDAVEARALKGWWLT